MSKIEKCPTCGAPSETQWYGLDLVAESGDETLASKGYKHSLAELQKGVYYTIVNNLNAGNLELHGICVNDLVKEIIYGAEHPTSS